MNRSRFAAFFVLLTAALYALNSPLFLITLALMAVGTWLFTKEQQRA